MTREQQIATFRKKLALAVGRKRERRREAEFDWWINLFLVWSGERPGYFSFAEEFYTHQRWRAESTLEERLKELVEPFGLRVVERDDQFLVTRKKVRFPQSTLELGKRLGMFAPGGNFGDWFQPRWGTEIREVTLNQQIYAEVCTADHDHQVIFNRMVERAENWNEACQAYGLPYRFQAFQSVMRQHSPD